MVEKILIVDDDIDSLKLIGLMLQRHGYEVIVASAGNQAISKAFSEQPDLIILDVMMPDMNGYEVCRRLRANPETQPIPIIMFTAKTLIDDKVAGFEAGADDYLTKPTHPAELASRVKSILQRNAGQRRKEVRQGSAVGILGTKGGLGTTTLALNLAAAFLKSGENPILTDFRLGNGSLGLYLGISRPTGMAAVLSRPINEIRPMVLEKEMVTHSSGIRVLLASTQPKEALLNYSTESAIGMIRGLRSLGSPIIADLGSGYSTLISRLVPELDELILTVEPSTTTLAMARELLVELQSLQPRQVHIVVIDTHLRREAISWSEVEKGIGQELRAIIASAPEVVAAAAEQGTSVVQHQPGAVMSSQIIKLAEGLKMNQRSPA